MAIEIVSRNTGAACLRPPKTGRKQQQQQWQERKKPRRCKIHVQKKEVAKEELDHEDGVFTDGSYFGSGPRRAGFGVYFDQEKLGYIERVPVDEATGLSRFNTSLLRASALSMEMLAIDAAVREIAAARACGRWRSSNLFVYTDSLLALELIEGFITGRPDHSSDLAPVIQKILLTAEMSGLTNLYLCKVRAHDNILENNLADSLARRGAEIVDGSTSKWLELKRMSSILTTWTETVHL